MNVDLQLIKDCRANKPKAQKLLFESCYLYYMSICRRYSKDDQEAMSLLNLGFYKILVGLDKWKEHIPFKTWSKRVLINSIIDEYRKNKTYREVMSHPEHLDYGEAAMTGSTNNLSDAVWAEEEVLHWTRTLPAMTAQVFNLYAVEGFPYEEIAEQLNVTEVTVRWHIHEARKRLKLHLKQTANVN